MGSPKYCFATPLIVIIVNIFDIDLLLCLSINTYDTGGYENGHGDSVVKSEHNVVDVDGISLHNGLDVAGDVENSHGHSLLLSRVKIQLIRSQVRLG